MPREGVFGGMWAHLKRVSETSDQVMDPLDFGLTAYAATHWSGEVSVSSWHVVGLDRLR